MDSAIARDQRLRRALREHGHRLTDQRAAVYRYLCSTTSHPTAEDVFVALRRDVAEISLATVYKSLETLVGCGLAQRLHYGESSARYDGCTDPHYHAHCEGCGRLIDVPGNVELEPVVALAEAQANFQVTGVRLELSGLCAECQPAR